jgi:hypothetical protein
MEKVDETCNIHSHSRLRQKHSAFFRHTLQRVSASAAAKWICFDQNCRKIQRVSAAEIICNYLIGGCCMQKDVGGGGSA